MNLFKMKLQSIFSRLGIRPSRRGVRFREVSTVIPPFRPVRKTLAKDQEAYIRSKLDAAWEAWMNGTTPRPEYEGVFESNALAAGERLAIVMSRYVNSDPAYIENDFALHLHESATDAGFDCCLFYADNFTYKECSEIDAEIANLSGFIEDNRPDIIVIDANYIPSDRQLNKHHLVALKEKYNFKLMCVLGDCYGNSSKQALSYWEDCTDIYMIFNRYSDIYTSFAHQDRVLVSPALPHASHLFVPTEPKAHDLYYCGSTSRQRDAFVHAAEHAGLDVLARFHKRLAVDAPTTEQYLSEMASSKLTFGNGYVFPGLHIITARVAESILAGAVLLYEAGSEIDDYLVPYVHYIPVRTTHEAAAYGKFIADNDAYRKRMAEEARRYWMDHYSSRHIWAAARKILQG